MSDTIQSQPARTTRRVITLAVLMCIIFLLGFSPMWYKLRNCTNYLSEFEQQFELVRIQNALASSVIDAQRGDYEPARQSASIFFTSLLAETDRQKDSFLSQEERKEMFMHRDEIITLLARNDPASANKLSDLYVLYRKITNNR